MKAKSGLRPINERDPMRVPDTRPYLGNGIFVLAGDKNHCMADGVKLLHLSTSNTYWDTNSILLTEETLSKLFAYAISQGFNLDLTVLPVPKKS